MNTSNLCGARVLFVLTITASLVLPSANLRAQWSANPAVNLPVCDAAGDQVQSKIRNATDGGSCVSWFDGGAGFDVYLQRLLPDGSEAWAHNGVLVADRSVSSTEDYGLAVDASNNTVMAYGLVNFSSIQVQKINSAGALQWGSGVTVSTPGGAHSPKVAATSDGNYVVAWSEGSVLSIVLQKFNASGVAQWGSGIVYTDPPTSRNLFLCDIQPSDNGSVIVEWFRCAGSNCATSAHHLYTQKYDSTGAAVWNGGVPIILFNGTSTANGYFPTCISDGAGGAVYGWYETGGSQLCYVQRINAAGAEVYAHNGVACTVATPGRMRISAALGFDPSNGDMFLGWSEVTLPSQNMWGVRAQKVSNAGVRQWGDEGISVKPLDGNQTSFVQAAALGGGCVVSYFDATSGSTGSVKAARLDSGGTQIWTGSPITPCTRNTGKSRLDMSMDSCGMSKLVWSDGPSGGQDILAQNVRSNGTLGPQVPGPLGDMNCDGQVTLLDIDPFVLALIDPAAYSAAQPCCLIDNADMNADSREDGQDCAGLADLLVP
jgi:hypothetical protein